MRLSGPLSLALGGRRHLTAPLVGVALDGSGDYVSTPAPASGPLDITGPIDIRFEFEVDSTAGGTQFLVSKDASARAYTLSIEASPKMFELYTFGSATLASNVTVAQIGGAKTDLESRYMIRVTREAVDASNYVTKWYTSTNWSTWTLKFSETKAGAFNINSNSTAIRLLSRQSVSVPSFTAGTVYRCEIRNGIDGTVVGSPQFATADATSVIDAQANTWTVTKT